VVAKTGGGGRGVSGAAAAVAAAAALIATDTSILLFLANACTKFKVYLPTPPFIGGYSPETTKTFMIAL
jgi:hypothetical protein